MPHMTDSPDPRKEAERQQVAADVEAFFAAGGKIEHVEIQQRDGHEYMPRASNGQKCLTINPAKMRARQGWKENGR